MMVLIDSDVLLDIWDLDPVWNVWSSSQLRALSSQHEFAINPVVYAEISTRFSTQAKLDERLDELEIRVLDISRGSAFLASKAFVQYRRQGGTRIRVLPDFFIGAHAVVLGCPLLTRDRGTYSTYFPGVQLIAP
jgi:hypothetical protein